MSSNQKHFRSDSTKKYFEDSKRTVSDIHPCTFHLGSGVAGKDKLGQTVLHTGLGGGSTHFANF